MAISSNRERWFCWDSFDEGGSGFVGAGFAAGEFGFGGDEAAFAGGFEDGGTVAF